MEANKLISEVDFSLLMERIVLQVLPDEVVSFEIGGEEIIYDVYRNGKLSSTNNGGEINFLQTGKEVLEFVSLILSTYKLITEVYKLISAKSAKNNTLVADKWRTLLVEAGIEDTKAKEIAEKFTDPLLITININGNQDQ